MTLLMYIVKITLRSLSYHNIFYLNNTLYVFLGPTAPRSLMVVNDSVTDTNVTLSWMSPDPPNGIITEYQIQYRRNSSTGDYMQKSIMNSTQNYTVTKLTSNTEYVFQVRAFTTVGSGDFSNSVTVRTSEFE